MSWIQTPMLVQAKPQGLLWAKDEPIIPSLAVTDVYKILMLNHDFWFYPNTSATFSFINRTDVDLLKYIDINELREQLAHVASLRFTPGEVDYMMSWKIFRPYFRKELTEYQLEMPEVSITTDGRLSIDARGPVTHSSGWEIPVLSIVSELYSRGRAKAEGYTEQQLFDAALVQLKEKALFLKDRPYLKGSQFGLRRRKGALWERFMTEYLLEHTDFLTGASNVWLARELGIEAQGTNAHQLPMLAYGFARGKSNHDARQSVYDVLRNWQFLYGQDALVMLTDAYGSDAFFDKLPDEFMYLWKGFRQDSGDAFAYGEDVIARCERLGIDPLDKLLIFSDGLNGERMDALYQRFGERIVTRFGVGTWLSNDTGGLIIPLSLVMKLTEVDGRPTVKLSDNLAKATGDPEEIKVAKHIFGHTSTFTEEAVY